MAELRRSWRLLNYKRAVFSLCRQCLLRRAASHIASLARYDPTGDVIPDSSFATQSLLEDQAAGFDPVAKAKSRKGRLPSSRYKYRPPKYDSGPLHPHRSPPASDPSSRVFVPGPFSRPRLASTYHNTIAPDIITMCYVHKPPGFRPAEKGPRLRPWDDSSPYHENRPLRGPRGGDTLRLLRRPITFRTVPTITRITVHSYVKDAPNKGTSAPLHVAGMVVQAITNVRVTTHKSRMSEAAWGLIKDKTTVSMTAELQGEDMWHFLTKMIDVVMPRIKDWMGVRATTGDGSGNLSFGFEPEVVGMFPEVQGNYDNYPPKMIPGCYITIHTSARMDKDARLLLSALGIPFYGKIRD